MRLTQTDDFEYDLKMVTRNIEDRKRQAQMQLKSIMRASEEQARINAVDHILRGAGADHILRGF
jgi:hypothetical protein